MDPGPVTPEVARLREGGIAGGAGKGLLPRVHSAVSLQVAAGGERGRAVRTAEGASLGVLSHRVPPQLQGAGETDRADRARESFLVGAPVDPAVVLGQLALGDEGEPAVLRAGEGVPLARRVLPQFVPAHRARLAERRPALAAQIGFLSRVHPPVLPQLGVGQEAGRAVRAAERQRLARVVPPQKVALQGVGVSEGRVAPPATEGFRIRVNQPVLRQVVDGGESRGALAAEKRAGAAQRVLARRVLPQAAGVPEGGVALAAGVGFPPCVRGHVSLQRAVAGEGGAAMRAREAQSVFAESVHLHGAGALESGAALFAAEPVFFRIGGGLALIHVDAHEKSTGEGCVGLGVGGRLHFDDQPSLRSRHGFNGCLRLRFCGGLGLETHACICVRAPFGGGLGLDVPCVSGRGRCFRSHLGG